MLTDRLTKARGASLTEIVKVLARDPEYIYQSVKRLGMAKYSKISREVGCDGTRVRYILNSRCRVQARNNARKLKKKHRDMIFDSYLTYLRGMSE